MKKKYFNKFGRMFLATILAVTMLLPSTAFAQADSSEAKLLEKSAYQSHIENGEAINSDAVEIDLSDFGDKLEDEATLQQYDEQSADYNLLPDVESIDLSTFDTDSALNIVSLFTEGTDYVTELVEDVPESTSKIIDEKSILGMTSIRGPINNSIDIDVAEISRRSANQSSRLLSPDSIESGTGINTFSKSATLSNTDPNSAIFLPESYYGYELYDLAGSTDRWYCFSTTGTNKISLMFQQEANGDYDLLLYKLDGSTLNLVDYSMESGTAEKINYIANGGTYYIRVTPYIPTTVEYYYVFMLNVISNGNFESYEPNDAPGSATVFTNTINTNANIDNPYDEDWYRLSVATAKTKDITVSNAPSGNHYAVFLYDSSFNSVGSFYANVTATRQVDFGVGQYYIRILSMTGYTTTANYNLKVADYVPPVQPLGSINLSWQRIEYPQIYVLSTLLPVKAGSRLVFDMNCTSAYGTNWDRSGIVMDVRYKGYSAWERLGDFWVTQGSNTYYHNLPYTMDHIVGRPLFPDGEVRITICPDGALDFTGTIKSMPN